MRDDEFDDDEPAGKIHYSGFDPTAERADYALPAGMAALQGGEPEFEPAGLSTRRGFLWVAVGTGALLGGGIGWSVGASSRPPDVPRPSETRIGPHEKLLLEGAKSVVDGPIEDLVATHGMFIYLVEQYGGRDPKLWEGMEKLARWSILDRQSKGVGIARRLERAFRVNPAPPAMYELLPQLDQLISDWERRTR